MKKTQFITFFFLIVTLQMAAQSYVPVAFIVSDFSTNKNVSGAQVSIRQAGWATKSTGTDGKVSFDNVPVGAINFIVTKDGYQLYEGEENVSAEVKSNTFRIPMTIIPTTKDKILVTGEVTDKEGRDVEGAWVEVKAANIIQNGLTDKSGNYSIEINLNTGYTVSNLAIEAKKGDCKVKQNVDIPRGNVVSKDIKLDCDKVDSGGEKPNGGSDRPVVNFTEQTARKNNMIYKITNCKQTGQEIECFFDVKSENKDDVLVFSGGDPRNSKIIDADTGFEYYCNSITIADLTDDKRVDKKVVAGITVKARLTFSGVNNKLKTLGLVDLSGGSGSAGWYHIEFRNVPVK